MPSRLASALTLIQRPEVLLAQNLAGMHRPHAVLECHVCLSSHPLAASVIVDDLDVLSACRGPTKTYAPLVINADAVLSETVSLQCFEAIARR